MDLERTIQRNSRICDCNMRCNTATMLHLRRRKLLRAIFITMRHTLDSRSGILNLSRQRMVFLVF